MPVNRPDWSYNGRALNIKPEVSRALSSVRRRRVVIRLDHNIHVCDGDLAYCNKRRLTASDCQEGNRRDCSMSGNQTSGKEGGVQCAVTVVCMYICLISYMSDSKETQACPSSVGRLSSLMLLELCTDSVLLTNEYRPSRAFCSNRSIPRGY